jgi:hypothetical protein
MPTVEATFFMKTINILAARKNCNKVDFQGCTRACGYLYRVKTPF